ncbi:Peptidyl-alpha-hydroxyglycine alpha-amidating lyase 2 [Fasciola hepatica]|uniref:peptidylamidoglycolate lyase n=1 Tax=Fasciola hepatica TaxID=6192 RepID=A0A4E0RHB3_FASHE|nr:Peptidyl-alpha-hydroxyglycine alpha-amidating lyase 2 [Fasciola hepatica]
MVREKCAPRCCVINIFLVLLVKLAQGYLQSDYLTEDEETGNILFPDASLMEAELVGEKPRLSLVSEWPLVEAYQHVGLVSAAAVVNKSSSDVFILNRGDRIWDSTTFDKNDIYQKRELGPIRDGVVVRLKEGQFQNSYLHNTLYLPHGITVDHQGNVWITDTAMHQVFKFGPDLNPNPILVIGEMFVPGSDGNHFCKPTHVVVLKSGEFFVADGYCNNRIMKFHSNGTFIKEWSKRSKSNDNTYYDFKLPHQLAFSEELDLLCVADREKLRVLCYRVAAKESSESQLKELIYEFPETGPRDVGPVYGVAIAPKERILFALAGEEQSGVPTAVYMFSLETGETLGYMTGENGNYGYAHSLASCDTDTEPGCLIVCSLDPPTNQWGEIQRRLWLYQFNANR